MADINAQPTDNLTGTAAAAKIQEIAQATRTCMFHTGLGQFPGDSRPMALQTVEEDGSCWFLSASNSEKNRDIAADPRVILSFQNESKMAYLSLSGHARIHTDRATIDRYWSAFAEAWFDGKDDPRLTVIHVSPSAGQYWETQNGKILAFAKMTWAALTKSEVDDGGVAGSLKP